MDVRVRAKWTEEGQEEGQSDQSRIYLDTQNPTEPSGHKHDIWWGDEGNADHKTVRRLTEPRRKNSRKLR